MSSYFIHLTAIDEARMRVLHRPEGSRESFLSFAARRALQVKVQEQHLHLQGPPGRKREEWFSWPLWLMQHSHTGLVYCGQMDEVTGDPMICCKTDNYMKFRHGCVDDRLRLWSSIVARLTVFNRFWFNYDGCFLVQPLAAQQLLDALRASTLNILIRL